MWRGVLCVVQQTKNSSRCGPRELIASNYKEAQSARVWCELSLAGGVLDV